jgi:hypothetical protein
MFSHDSDPPAVRRARQFELGQLGSWLASYKRMVGGGGGESFLRVHWVAVPQALRARRVNRRRRGREGEELGR